MTFRISETSICTDIGQLLANELRVRYGDRSSPVKRLARDLGVSEPTARGMFGGKLPATGTLLLAAKLMGSSAARRLFAPFIGDMPEQHEFEEMREIRSRLDRLLNARTERATHEGLAGHVSLATAEGPGQRADDGGRGGVPLGGRDREAARVAPVDGRYAATRRSLEVVARGQGEAGRHLTASLARWAECSGKADRSSLIEFANRTPDLRTSVVTEEGDGFVFNEITRAFRLHGSEREKRIGKPTTAAYDRDYAEVCDRNIRQVMAEGCPAVDDVDATVKAEPGVSLHLSYRRLILPYREGARRFAVCASVAA
jgi:hypothetical protein